MSRRYKTWQQIGEQEERVDRVQEATPKYGTLAYGLFKFENMAETCSFVLK